MAGGKKARNGAAVATGAALTLMAAALSGCFVGAGKGGGTVSLGSDGVSVEGDLSATGQLQITIDAWARLSGATGGVAVLSDGPSDIPSLIEEIIDRGVDKDVPADLVFVVDTTGSMGDDIASVQADIREISATLRAQSPGSTIGIVAYRDRGDDFLSELRLDLSTDDDAIEAGVVGLEVGGGGDLREHVYAGIDTALTRITWRQDATRHLIVMGDAPPHDDYTDDPRTFTSVTEAANAADVEIHTIGVQCDLACQALIAVGLGAPRLGRPGMSHTALPYTGHGSSVVWGNFSRCIGGLCACLRDRRGGRRGGRRPCRAGLGVAGPRRERWHRPPHTGAPGHGAAR